MKKILALFMAGLMTATVFAGCGSDEDWGYIQNKGSLNIGITYFEPMNYKDANGELTGFETEFAQAVCEELGVKAEFQEIEWESKEIELNSKTIDCIWNGLTITDERKENMGITVPYMENKQVMVVKKENLEKYAESLDGAIVVAEAGSAGEDVAKSDDFFKGTNYVPVAAQANALLEVKSGTADVAVIDYVMSIGTLRDGSDYGDLAVVESKSFAPEQYGIALRKADTETLTKVNNAIQAVADSGKLNEIAEKYNLSELLLVKPKAE